MKLRSQLYNANINKGGKVPKSLIVYQIFFNYKFHNFKIL